MKPLSKERKTIFLIDDEMTNLTVGKNALTEFYNVFTLNSAATLLRLLKKNIPDLILLDVNMPDMNGYDIIKLLKKDEETEHIPVVFLTANNDSSSELEGLSLGAVDYIVKPFSPSLLLKRIEIHLLLEEQRRELVNYSNNLKAMVEEKTASVLELQNAILQTMVELVECRDTVTGGHIERTQSYLGVLLDALQQNDRYKQEVNSWDKRLVLQSAQLHDVGKIGIKDNVLSKPGKLTDEEYEQIKEHVAFGEKIIAKIKERTTHHEFLEYANILAVSHHEKWDGTGYPKGHKGEDIPLLGRLMAIADIYDTLVSIRPYKSAFTHEEAVKIIREGKGTHFDPVLVEVFLDVSGKFNDIAEKWDKK